MSEKPLPPQGGPGGAARPKSQRPAAQPPQGGAAAPADTAAARQGTAQRPAAQKPADTAAARQGTAQRPAAQKPAGAAGSTRQGTAQRPAAQTPAAGGTMDVFAGLLIDTETTAPAPPVAAPATKKTGARPVPEPAGKASGAPANTRSGQAPSAQGAARRAPQSGQAAPAQSGAAPAPVAGQKSAAAASQAANPAAPLQTPQQKVNAAYKDFIAMTMPLLAMGLFYYGPRVLLMALVAVTTARLSDRVVAIGRGLKFDRTDTFSAAIALVLLMLLPATANYRMVVVSTLAAVLIGKEVFGGYRNYPFNPAAVGYCIAAVAWPNRLFQYPQPNPEAWLPLWNIDAVTLYEGPSAVLKNHGVPTLDIWNLLLGNYAGPIGATAVLVILSCALFFYVRKRLPMGAIVSFFVTAGLIAFLFPRAPEGAWTMFPWENLAQRLNSVKFELLTGGIFYAAVFMISEPGTLPSNRSSRIMYGILLGFATMMYRYFGRFEMGVCFAFLLVNAISGYFDRALASRRGVQRSFVLGEEAAGTAEEDRR